MQTVAQLKATRKLKTEIHDLKRAVSIHMRDKADYEIKLNTITIAISHVEKLCDANPSSKDFYRSDTAIEDRIMRLGKNIIHFNNEFNMEKNLTLSHGMHIETLVKLLRIAMKDETLELEAKAKADFIINNPGNPNNHNNRYAL